MSKKLEAPLNFTWGGYLKSITDQGILEGHGIVFGSEQKHDISSLKDFFTDKTFVHPEQKFITPLFMEHGFNHKTPIGKASMYKTETGWDVIAELDLENPTVKSKFNEIKEGGWGFSSGSSGHVVIREKKNNGVHHITQWPLAELSITKTPAEPMALIRSVKSLDEYYGVSEFIDEDTDQNFNDKTIEYYKEMNKELLELIRDLVTQATNKHIEENFIPQLDEFKTLIEDLKPILSSRSEERSDEEQEGTEELTVLKSSFEELEVKFNELTSSNTELQSSFNDKEVLLSEKVALLSEVEVELDVKSQEVTQLEEALKNANTEVEKQKLINKALAINNFNK